MVDVPRLNICESEPGSFRDRHSRIFYLEGTILRGLSQKALQNWSCLSGTGFFQRMMAEGKVIKTERIDLELSFSGLPLKEWAGVLRHEAIPFISYPYECSFGMLKDAALLQLELVLSALEEGMILKDSSAFNVQWQGTRPVFVDVGSFEQLNAEEPWVGYRQFCQMFLYPLFLQSYKDIPFQPWLRGNLEGIESAHCKNFLSFRDWFRPGVFMHVYLQAKAQAKYGQTNKAIKQELRTAGFHPSLIRANAKRLDKIIRGLVWKRTDSEWADYVARHSYADNDHKMKIDFVRRVIHAHPWDLVWDLGCNTGLFSRIAAENARYVVSMDADPVVIETLYQTLKKEQNTRILPLVCNLADASPSLGWRGTERKSLPSRGKPNLTLCLALIHHMVISANIPLNEFIEWLASLGSDLVIEFVTKDDPMVHRLLRDKDDQYDDYQLDWFKHCLSSLFSVVQKQKLASRTRLLYFCSSKTA